MKITTKLKSFEIDNKSKLTFIVGPCVIENRKFALETASFLKDLFESLDVNFIYKSSFDKANRTSVNSFRGVGIDEGLSILKEIKNTLDIPVLTDVHEMDQIEKVSSVVDYIQTPAFLCRQTDFIKKVAQTNLPINIKKGQFMSPYEMENVLLKAKSTGNTNISLCERGTTFGYGNLVVDMRGLEVMKKFGNPVIFDATHSVQLPGMAGNSSSGQREFVDTLATAAVSIGIAGVFMESHPNPDSAPCDGPNMVYFKDLKKQIVKLIKIDNLVKSII